MSGAPCSSPSRRQYATSSKRFSASIKGALLSSLAHDLRTPLTAVATAVENLRASELTDTQRASQADIARKGLDGLARLFQNILEMARIDAGRLTISRRWVHVSEVVDAARREIELTLGAHRVAIVDDTTHEVVRVDPRLVATALARLLENAAHYSAAGSTITVTSAVDSGGLVLHVDDEGTGVVQADAPHIFERFYRGSHSPRHRSGTGMGLAIVRGLVWAQGGRVWFENRPSRGARFSMLVPAESRSAEHD